MFSEGNLVDPIQPGYTPGDIKPAEPPQVPPGPTRHYMIPPAEMRELASVDDCVAEILRTMLAAAEATQDRMPQAGSLRAGMYDRVSACVHRAIQLSLEAADDSPPPTTPAGSPAQPA